MHLSNGTFKRFLASLTLLVIVFHARATPIITDESADSCSPDLIPPVITLEGSSIVSVALGDDYHDAGATAEDNCDGDLTAAIKIGGDKIDTSVIATYAITYNVSDKSANAADEITRTVHVVEELTISLPGGVPLEIVHIPAGTFMMGRTSEEQDSSSFEEPQHQVTISHSFYMGKYEVTQEQWHAVMGSWPKIPPSSEYGLGGQCPIYRVSWLDTQDFLAALNMHIAAILPGKHNARLPTEAEWEYACRAGTTTRFYWGDDPDYKDIENYAWYRHNSKLTDVDRRGSHPVGMRRPNAFGLHDMAGNIWEWCLDREGNYSSEPLRDPSGPKYGRSRILRGGSWNDEGWICRSSSRSSNLDKSRNCNTGFRIVIGRN